jgi:hypothetical protein
MRIWIVSAAQAQVEQINLIPRPVQYLMATVNRWGTSMRIVATATFWEPRRAIFRPTTCRHRKEEILKQAKLQPATATTARSRWTSSDAE